MVNSDKKTEKVLREKGFRFTLVKIELVVAHPCFYVIYAWLQVTCKALYIIWWSWFLKLGVVFKKLMVDWVTGYDLWKWSSVQNKQHRSLHWALWNAKHERRRRGSRIVDNHALTFVQKIWSKALESGRADAKDSFETEKKNLVIDSIKCSWKIQ